MWPPSSVFTDDCGSLGGLRPSQREGPGLISGEARPPGRLRPCRAAPAGASRPPTPPARATPALAVRPRRARLAHRQPPQGPLHVPVPTPREPREPQKPREPGKRESKLAIPCCECTVGYGGMAQPCWPDNSIGGDRFRLRWSNQGKRAEGCGCDLVNPVTANQ